MITAIRHVVRRHVRDGVLVAELVANVLEGLIQIVHVIGEKRAPTGFLGKALKNLVALRQVILAVAQFLGIRLRKRNPLRARADGGWLSSFTQAE